MAAQNSVLTQIARPYASALFDLATSDSKLNAIEADLDSVARLAVESEDFARFLRSPVITGDVKAATLEPILTQIGADPLLGNFLRLIAKNGRLFALPVIITEFRALAAKARGESSADVTSAVPLSEAQVAALAATLQAKLGKTVSLNQHVDASLIGGLQVKIGSQMIDSSLKTKLTAIKIAMKEVG